MEKISRRERERQIHEAEIIAAAEKVFSQKGYENASMDQIALEAQFTKRTIYQYFAAKEDLYLAVTAKWFEQLLSYFETAVEKGRNGFEKMQGISRAYYQFYLDFPESFPLLFSGFIKFNLELAGHRRIVTLKQSALEELIALIKAGISDGSLRVDLDPKLAAHSFMYLLSGFCSMLHDSANNLQLYHVNQEELIRFSLDAICDAYKA